MKTSLSSGVTLAVLCAVIVPMSAQTQSTTVQVSKLVGTKVKSSQGEEIGVVKDVMIDRSTGCMAYTVLSTGDGGETRAAGGGKLVAVPWAVYSPVSDVNVLTVTVDRGRIYSAPVSRERKLALEFPRTSTTGVSTGATSGTSAAGSQPAGSVSPAAPTSPAARRSPGPAASPAGRESPSPHETPAKPRATASSREHEGATPPNGEERGRRVRPRATESPSGRSEEERGTRARPEETESATGGAELQREPSEATRESPSDATNSDERTSEGNQKRPHRKPERREANTPPPDDRSGEQR